MQTPAQPQPQSPVTPAATPVVEIRDLAKGFGRGADRVRALDGVTLSVRRGEVFGLLGRNGSGKTTLVRTLLGLLDPDWGSVRLFGRDAGDLDVRRRVGYSPEEPGFPKYLFPRQVLAYCGALSGLRGGELEAAVERELARAELQAAAGRQARTLSKGMRQRLSLAQAFLHGPELLVLDEPTADLDPIGRRQVRDMIVEFRARGGTVLLNSHLLSEVERVCDRVAVIHGGRLLREGPIDELLAGDRELEDVFIEVIEGAGGGAGYAARWQQPPAQPVQPPPPEQAGQPAQPPARPPADARPSAPPSPERVQDIQHPWDVGRPR